MPLTDHDIEKIDELFVKNFETIWEKHLEPNMVVKKDLEETEKRIGQRVIKENQDTRDYVAKKVAELDGTSVRRDATLNTKTDTVVRKLQGKSVFTAEEVREISRIAPVAVSPMP
jgi:hypothetical protein